MGAVEPMQRAGAAEARTLARRVQPERAAFGSRDKAEPRHTPSLSSPDRYPTIGLCSSDPRFEPRPLHLASPGLRRSTRRRLW